MVLTGGKRKANKSLMAWVKFVKKVQKEEKLNYKEAIHRAKQRKDKGEKWMTGGADMSKNDTTATSEDEEDMGDMTTQGEDMGDMPMEKDMEDENMSGGRRRRRTMRRSRGKGRASVRARGRTARRSRGRSARRSRGRA